MENTGLKILVHASAFFAPFAVPIVVFLLCHFSFDDHEVKKLSIQAILFQLVMGVFIFVSALLSFIVIGIPLLIGLVIMWIVVPIIGIIKAINGEDYNYPVVGAWYR